MKRKTVARAAFWGIAGIGTLVGAGIGAERASSIRTEWSPLAELETLSHQEGEKVLAVAPQDSCEQFVLKSVLFGAPEDFPTEPMEGDVDELTKKLGNICPDGNPEEQSAIAWNSVTPFAQAQVYRNQIDQGYYLEARNPGDEFLEIALLAGVGFMGGAVLGGIAKAAIDPSALQDLGSTGE